jgi:thiamine biosynthesis lipoprotein
VEDSLSSYKNSASLFQLNQTKQIHNDPLLVEALNQSIGYYEDTKGYFDITIGSITKKLYRFGEIPASPTQNALQNAPLDIRGIHLTPDTIVIDQNITLDLGGMGKGFAIDKVASYFSENNVYKGSAALSGDIRCLDRCEVSLQSPFSEQSFAKITTLHPNTAISTSGTYRRYATTKEEHHLIDPKLRSPQKNFLSISLFKQGDNSKLDAYATAVSVMPPEEVHLFLSKHHDISFVLVDTQGKIYYNDSANLIKIKWEPYHERTTLQPITQNNPVKAKTSTTLTHPIISRPVHIKR